jgi:hypothetical protein
MLTQVSAITLPDSTSVVIKAEKRRDLGCVINRFGCDH